MASIICINERDLLGDAPFRAGSVRRVDALFSDAPFRNGIVGRVDALFSDAPFWNGTVGGMNELPGDAPRILVAAGLTGMLLYGTHPTGAAVSVGIIWNVTPRLGEARGRGKPLLVDEHCPSVAVALEGTPLTDSSYGRGLWRTEVPRVKSAVRFRRAGCGNNTGRNDILISETYYGTDSNVLQEQKSL